jgi:DNA-binding response OmpR family regulator
MQLQEGDLVIDPATREVSRGGSRISLTRTEYSLLEQLAHRAGTVVRRQSLIEAVWGFDREVEDNTLDVFMRLLRSKIEGGTRQKLIHTVRGVGYMLRTHSPA